MDKRKRRLLCMLEGSGQKSRWISGVPPLQYSAKKQGTLKNYRIYGNTVDGESVGDRTGNLFDEGGNKVLGYINDNGELVEASYPTQTYDYMPILPNSDYTFIGYNYQSDGKIIRVAWFDSSKNFISRTYELDGHIAHTKKSPANAYYARLSIDVEIKQIMFNSGSTVLPYEPYGYKVPVTVSNGTDTLTTPIYLPEQIKKVGDEAEYIDYAEQKMHRIGADDIDVTLPALPTLPGTNVLSVGTEVQPSKIEVKGKIKAL